MIAIGVDTGADGAIGIIERDDVSGVAKWTTYKFEKCPSGRGLDCVKTATLVAELPVPAGSDVWIENNVGRPENMPDLAFRHGLNSGELKMAFACYGFRLHMVAPQEWTMRLGIRGKTDDNNCKGRAKYLSEQYPGIESVIYGPRGGVQYGAVDALLIAHYGMISLQTGAMFGGGTANVKNWVRRGARGLY